MFLNSVKLVFLEECTLLWCTITAAIGIDRFVETRCARLHRLGVLQHHTTLVLAWRSGRSWAAHDRRAWGWRPVAMSPLPPIAVAIVQKVASCNDYAEIAHARLPLPEHVPVFNASFREIFSFGSWRLLPPLLLLYRCGLCTTAR